MRGLSVWAVVRNTRLLMMQYGAQAWHSEHCGQWNVTKVKGEGTRLYTDLGEHVWRGAREVAQVARLLRATWRAVPVSKSKGLHGFTQELHLSTSIVRMSGAGASIRAHGAVVTVRWKSQAGEQPGLPGSPKAHCSHTVSCTNQASWCVCSQ